MRVMRLSLQNLKRNFTSYVAFILSLSFCSFILYNFLNLMDSGALDILGQKNKEFSEMLIAAVSFVLAFFVFCFIWYASNVFLGQRKKEMGTFIFMGLDNKQLGKMFFFEMMMVGVLAIASGILAGILFSKLFGMLFFKLSDIEASFTFGFQIITVIKTALIFLVLYGILMLKGYFNIVRTSVKDMLSATKQSEFKKANGFMTFFKAFISLCILCAGYYCALQIGDISSFVYMLLATIFVIIGIYGLYDSLMPYILTKLSDHKGFLYRKERNLWINHLIFRIKKNYRTYAIVTIMMLCCISALGAGLAMKQRYDAMNYLQSQYVYNFMGDQLPIDKINATIEKNNTIQQKASIPFFFHQYHLDKYTNDQLAFVVSYKDYITFCKEAGLTPLKEKPQDFEAIELHKKYLVSLATDIFENVPIDHKELKIIASDDTAYFGLMQDQMNVLIVNDKTFAEVSKDKMMMDLYVVNIENQKNYREGMEDLKAMTNDHLQVMIPDLDGGNIVFIRVIYSLCIFMFAVFAFSCGGVLFMKTYNDANDDRQRYIVLKNIGISKRSMRHAIQKELAFTYVLPIAITTFSSYFIMRALQNLMKSEPLRMITVISIVVLSILFMILYVISVKSFEKRCEINK